MSIAQLTVMFSNAEGQYQSEDVIGGLFVHDIWSKDVRRPSGLWRWEPKTQPIVMRHDSRWAIKGGVSGRWTRNGEFLDLYMFQTKVAFVRWWGGTPVGAALPPYRLGTGAILVEDPVTSFEKQPNIVNQLGGDKFKWLTIGFTVNYETSPSPIPWRMGRPHGY